MSRVRISDVAREAGVSLGTVSNALNRPDIVKPETLKAVNEAIDKLGYVPNQAARQLAGSESRVLGLALPRLDHAFSLQIANGAQSESHAHGYDLLIASAGNDDLLENHYMRYFLGAHIAGVLVQPMAEMAWKPPLEATPIPTVYLDVHGADTIAVNDAASDELAEAGEASVKKARGCKSSAKKGKGFTGSRGEAAAKGLMRGSFVAADNVAQGRLIAQHALSCGSRRIVVIGEAQFMQLALRMQGIRDVAEQAGAELEVIDRGDWNTAEDGFEIGRELASRTKSVRPHFIIGLTDVLAAGAIDGVMSAGLNVPADMLVAGCDGNPLAWSGSVSLTTLTSPGFEIGRRGVQLLLEHLESKSPVECKQELVPSMLLERTSTAISANARKNAVALDLNLAEYLSEPIPSDN